MILFCFVEILKKPWRWEWIGPLERVSLSVLKLLSSVDLAESNTRSNILC